VLAFSLPSHKADCLFEGNCVLLQQTTTVNDPYTTFMSYIHLCDHLFPFSPELWLRSNGTIPGLYTYYIDILTIKSVAIPFTLVGQLPLLKIRWSYTRLVRASAVVAQYGLGADHLRLSKMVREQGKMYWIITVHIELQSVDIKNLLP
jgi:hypothetical protein